MAKYDNPYAVNPCDTCCDSGFCECEGNGGCCLTHEYAEKSDIWRAGYRSGRDEQREYIREHPGMLVKIYGGGPIDVSKMPKPDLDKLGELCAEMLAKIKERRDK